MSADSGRDTFHAKNPKYNHSVLGKPSETKHAARGATASPTGRLDMSAQVQRLAKRLGKKPEELAGKIPADTLRRTKFPVKENVNEDGTRSFEHDLGIVDDGRMASFRA